MISRGNYVAITLIMCVVLLMFQLTGVSENVLMNSGQNLYSTEAVTQQEVEGEKNAYDQITASLKAAEKEDAVIGLVGTEEECLEVAREWSISQKKTYCYYKDLKEAAEDESGATFLVIDGRKLDSSDDAQALRTLTEQGRNIVVSSLPDPEIFRENPALQSNLGIAEIRSDSIKVDGFKLFAGLIIGGETVYKDYEQNIPYAVLDDSVTAYAVAQSGQGWFQNLENEELPAIIWRYSPDIGKVYVVNGDYLEGQTGAGILTGFFADSQEVCLYPVVNAQLTVVENYMLLADENEEVMDSEYGQSSSIVFRDILWPSIVAIFYDTEDSMTVTGALRLDYTQTEKLDESLLQYYYEQITKEQGEIGISGYQISNLPLAEKLEQDVSTFDEVLPNYEIRVFQSGDMDEDEYSQWIGEGNILENIKTVLKDYEEDAQEGFFSYLNDEVLELPIYMDATVTDDEDDFRARNLVTAYGYYGTGVDVSNVVYPRSEKDSWNIMSNEWAKNYRPYRTPFESFEKLTATETDRRVRNYLSMDYDVQIQDDTVEIITETQDESSYFMLRLHGEEISEMQGGTYEEIEDGWYLLTVQDETAQISLEQSNICEYYIE